MQAMNSHFLQVPLRDLIDYGFSRLYILKKLYNTQSVVAYHA